MIYRLNVWTRLSTEMLAGEMVCEIGESGRAKGAFRYASDYLQHKDSFPLDPVSLPLRSEVFEINQPGIARVFEDSLPDDWGRKLLVRKHAISRHNQNLATMLEALGSSGLGTLIYSSHNQPEPPLAAPSAMHLLTLLDEAEKFERGETKDSEISMILGAGSSPGGARPKALITDGDTGIQYIAKFPSTKDMVDVVKIEAATMSLAAKAGLDIPVTRLSPCGSKSVLLVERFDIVPSGRRHMISLQTLLKAEGFYTCSYRDILNIVRKYSAEPAIDSERFFRQMVFNAVIGNTDDHLKNFWMVYGLHEGWRLSPAFDLVPDIGQRGEHVLFFDLGAYYPGRSNLEKLGRTWGVSKCDKIVEQVFTATINWQEEFTSFGVPEQDIRRFKEIDDHLRK